MMSDLDSEELHTGADFTSGGDSTRGRNGPMDTRRPRPDNADRGRLAIGTQSVSLGVEPTTGVRRGDARVPTASLADATWVRQGREIAKRPPGGRPQTLRREGAMAGPSIRLRNQSVPGTPNGSRPVTPLVLRRCLRRKGRDAFWHLCVGPRPLGSLADIGSRESSNHDDAHSSPPSTGRPLHLGRTGRHPRGQRARVTTKISRWFAVALRRMRSNPAFGLPPDPI